MQDFWKQLAPELVNAAVLLVGLAVTLLAAWLKGLIVAKTKGQLLESALVLVNDTVWTVVAKLNQVMADDLRAAAKDGKLTAEERSQLATRALIETKRLLGEVGMAKLREALGLSEEALGDYLASKIEARVGAEKPSLDPILG